MIIEHELISGIANNFLMILVSCRNSAIFIYKPLVLLISHIINDHPRQSNLEKNALVEDYISQHELSYVLRQSAVMKFISRYSKLFNDAILFQLTPRNENKFPISNISITSKNLASMFNRINCNNFNKWKVPLSMEKKVRSFFNS